MHNYHATHDVFPPGYITGTENAKPNSPETGPGWGWGTMILSDLEQRVLYNTANFNLPITGRSSDTVRTTTLAVYLCPSSTGRTGPVALQNASGNALISDLAAGQYVASAGQLEVEEFPAQNNGIFYRNSRNGVRDIRDGTSMTLMAGERSRNLADASWVGVIPYSRVCTNPAWPRRMRHRQRARPEPHRPDPGRALGRRPEPQGGRPRRLLEPTPRRLQLPVLRRIGAIPQGIH